MSDQIETHHARCPLCGNDDNKEVYTRSLRTTSRMGAIKIRNVMCNVCGIMYMNPQSTPEAIRSYYVNGIDASGNTYHSSNSGSRHDLLKQERTHFLHQQLKERDSGVLLDIGCARGEFLLALDLPGWLLWGLEPSKHAANFAKDHGINIICQDIESASLGSDRFDAISCISTLEHIYNPALALSKMVKALKPHGKIMIEVPDSTKPIAQVAEFYSNEHLTHFTLGTLSKFLSKQGIEICRIDDQVSIPNLRVMGEKAEITDSLCPFDDREQLLKALSKYKKERSVLEATLSKRFSVLIANWKANSSRVAIYGAGMHSLFFLEAVDLEKIITCFIDGDPKKRNSTFLKWNVFGPESINTLNLDAIIISSKDFQEEIFKSLSQYQFGDIEIVKCYP